MLGTFLSIVMSCLIIFAIVIIGLIGTLIIITPILLCLTLCKSIITGQFYTNLNNETIKGGDSVAFQRA